MIRSNVFFLFKQFGSGCRPRSLAASSKNTVEPAGLRLESSESQKGQPLKGTQRLPCISQSLDLKLSTPAPWTLPKQAIHPSEAHCNYTIPSTAIHDVYKVGVVAKVMAPHP